MIKSRVKSFILLLLCAFSVLNAAERKIGILIRDDYKGEISFAYRIKSACKNIHWEADVIDIQNPGEHAKKNYDFVINLVPGNYKHSNCKNYLAIFHPKHHYFNKKKFLKAHYRSYDGYLLTYTPGADGNGKKDFANSDRFPYLQWYPTVQKQEYRVTDPAYLFHICSTWGNRYVDAKFRHLLSLLDKDPHTRLYGSPKVKPLYPRSYQGMIPFDDGSLYERAAQAGVSLVIHSSEHNAHGLPSGRIFEAAASSTVIICDQNSFVRNHFGETVLYINTDENSLSIYNQIQHHLEWIKANKSQALEKAQKAHAIYLEKFLLEDQLLRLGEFHDRLSKPTPRSLAGRQKE
jgi:hypothetical protein